jgi:ATP-binding protein involved in chromosome partitioning
VTEEMPGTGPTEEEILDALRGVIDPELGDNVVDLGMVRAVSVPAPGHVRVDVALTIAGCPLRAQLDRDVRVRLTALPQVREVEVEMGEMDPEARAELMNRARWRASQDAPETGISPATRILAVGSGKGGVGKSSVSVNLAVALARRGLTVGLLDADIWGFSVPRLLGMGGGVEARKGKMIPLERPVGDGSVKVLSMGFLAEEDRAIMWRGLVLNRAVRQFLEDAEWGELDYLLIDLPPGTELLLVTTPPVAAQKVAARAADMARRGYLRVAGVIENMRDFTCEHGQRYQLFGEGGGARLAAEIGVPLVGSIPVHPEIASAGDAGVPVALGTDELAEAFGELARVVAEEVAPVLEASGCTARLLDRLAAATAPEPPAREAG